MNLTTSSSNYTVQASFNNSCIANLVFDPSDGNQQFSAVNVAGCAPQGENVVFQPVVFWYYFQDTSSNAPQVAAVFCNPTMDIFGTTTSKNLNDGSLGQCAIIDDFVQPNNVTGSPLNGRPYNGSVIIIMCCVQSFTDATVRRVTFNQSDTIFVAARAIAINSGVPGTIYRYASQQPGGLQAIFNNQNGWLNATTKIYVSLLPPCASLVLRMCRRRRNTLQLLLRRTTSGRLTEPSLQSSRPTSHAYSYSVSRVSVMLLLH